MIDPKSMEELRNLQEIWQRALRWQVRAEAEFLAHCIKVTRVPNLELSQIACGPLEYCVWGKERPKTKPRCIFCGQPKLES